MLADLLSILSLAVAIALPPDCASTRAVRSLPVDTAKAGATVRLTGVVTFSPPSGNYFYLQDRTGGVRVEWLADRQLRPGETVQIIGTTIGGTFLPEVKAKRVVAVREPAEDRLPESVPYALALDDSGYLDGQWVEVEAVVQRVLQHDGWLQYDLLRGRGNATAYVPLPQPAEAEKARELVGEVVKLRGVCRASATPARQISGPPRILVGDPGAIRVVPGRRRDPAALVPSLARDLAAFRPDPIEARLPVRMDGVVTLNLAGRHFCVGDDTGIALVFALEAVAVKPGDRVRVNGFPRGHDPVRLESASVDVIGTGPMPAPQPGTPAQAAAGRLDGHVVRFSGRVTEAARQGEWMTLVVTADGATFTAMMLESLAGADDPKPPAVPGSVVEVVGVVTRQPLSGIARTAFVLAVRPGGLTVVSVPPEPPPAPEPPWWTTRRVAYLSAGFLGLFLLGGATLTTLRVQVRRARALARQRSEENARLEGRLEQSSQLEAVGRVAGGVAHDFNNILTVINGCAQLLDEQLAADPTRAATLAADIRRAGRLATALNALLLAFSRQRVIVPHPLDVDAIIADAAPVLGRLLARQTTFRVTPTPGLPFARAETGLLLQVLINLTVNAGEAMPDGGTFALATSAPEPGWVRVTATDTGAGMPPEVQARVFERGFTTKPAGTGTGLSTVHEVVRALGGRVRCRSAVGRGTEFEVDLPAVPGSGGGPAPLTEAELATTPVRADDTSDAAPPVRPDPPVVLLVDDDDDVRSYVRYALERAGLSVLAADGPEAALALLAERSGPVDLLLTDLTMPGMGGRQLAALVRAARPGVRVLFVSGAEPDEPFGNEDGVNFLKKPFTPSELSDRVYRLLGQPA